ncbi:MAG: hypothetical protein ACOCUU_00950 [Nanoarchaeota archaeon]
MNSSTKSKLKNIVLKILGIYLFVLGIVAYANVFIEGIPEIGLWFCYPALILLGIGLFFFKPNLILSQVAILTIPLIIWNIDFYSILFTENSLFGTSDFFFQLEGFISQFVSAQHLYSFLLGFVGLWLIKKKPDSKSWKIAFVEIIVLFILSLTLTPTESNINCVFESCVPFISLGVPWYQFCWVLVFGGVVFGIDWLVKRVY